MPEEEVRDLAGKHVPEDSFARLVGHFRVPPDALAWRLKALGLIGARDRASLGAMPVQQAALLGGWREDYGSLTRDQGRPRLPVALAARAVDAFVSGTIAARPVATLLRVDSSTSLELHGNASDTAADDARAVFAP